MKKLILFLFCLSTTLFGANMSMTFHGGIPDGDKSYLTDNIDKEFSDVITDFVNDGYVVTVRFDIDPMNDGPDYCEVDIDEETDKGGGGEVGLKTVAKVGGHGHTKTKRKVRVKGPCKEVRKILKDIRANDRG